LHPGRLGYAGGVVSADRRPQLPLDTSLSQGVTILNDAIFQNFAENNDTVVLGYSQSATIASLN
jgi:PE-PPE domain